MRKYFLLVALVFAFSAAKAQTNLQEMYDFGRGHLVTTLEMFKPDKWGSTFFFTDIYHPNGMAVPSEFYTEISRSLNFWQNSKLANLSLHVEWNGGVYANNAWLTGVEWLFHSGDFSKMLTIQLLYKDISNNDNIPLQVTAVFGLQNLFGVKGLLFTGVADVWGQELTWEKYIETAPGLRVLDKREETHWVWLVEPQLWYNVGQHFGCPNLSVGGEVELSYNFAGGPHPNTMGLNYSNKGFNVSPCAGVKWVF
ncbi:MAG: DUF5020 family protein [Bacteroidales bacterium]|nr:DUF5020 family protein [Bacteroidales bacterium]